MALPSLTSDCDACAALCCVAFSFVEGQGFGAHKEADTACPKLAGHRCTIFGARAASGWAACDHYACQGAGPYVTQTLFEGRSWQDDPALLPQMAAAMREVRPIFDALDLLRIAEDRWDLTPEQQKEVDLLRADLWPETGWDLERLRTLKPQSLLQEVTETLRRFRAALTSD